MTFFGEPVCHHRHLERRQGPVLKQRDFGSVVAQSREISCPNVLCTIRE